MNFKLRKCFIFVFLLMSYILLSVIAFSFVFEVCLLAYSKAENLTQFSMPLFHRPGRFMCQINSPIDGQILGPKVLVM